MSRKNSVARRKQRYLHNLERDIKYRKAKQIYLKKKLEMREIHKGIEDLGVDDCPKVEEVQEEEEEIVNDKEDNENDDDEEMASKSLSKQSRGLTVKKTIGEKPKRKMQKKTLKYIELRKRKSGRPISRKEEDDDC